MYTHIILLRGINVSGKRKIPMADLRSSLEQSGFSKVETYIQTGNIILTSPNPQSQNIKTAIAVTIHKKFGFDDIPILALTPDELKTAISNYPFECPEEQKYVTFLETELKETEDTDTKTGDSFKISGKYAFVKCLKYGKTKFSNTYFEKKFDTEATTRNWKTLLQLASMVNK